MSEPDERIAGEEALIGFLRPLAAGFPGAFALEDDCAALVPPQGCELILKTDAVAAGVHFLPEDDPADIGWKALAVNVSDIAAKGARPLVYLMSLAFPEPPRTGWLAAFASGLAQAQTEFGCHLAGGDTDRRPGPMSMTIAIVGAAERGRMVRRGGARPGDRLYVSGTLGDAALGLKLRQSPALAAAWGLEPAGVDVLVRRYMRPQPRLALADVLRRHAAAAMDLSDGLAKDLGRMCRASGVGAVMRADLVPLSPPATAALARDPALIKTIVAAGDDYEILAAVPSGSASQFEAEARGAGVPVTPIGEIRAGGGLDVLDSGGVPIELGVLGYDHF